MIEFELYEEWETNKTSLFTDIFYVTQPNIDVCLSSNQKPVQKTQWPSDEETIELTSVKIFVEIIVGKYV